METNKSILTREVVAIDDRKKMGRMKDLCIDCDTRSVSHYIISNATTNSALVLPFEKSLAVGDTFMTVQSRDDFLGSASDEAKSAIDQGFRLVGVEVFSRVGNRLGVIENYEFDPIYGTVTKITLGQRLSFPVERFVFFSSDFVFVDDDEATAHDLRSGAKGVGSESKDAAETSVKETPTPIMETQAAPPKAEPTVVAEVLEEKQAAEEPVVADSIEEAKSAETPAAEKADDIPLTDILTEAIADDDALKEFLIGAVTNDDVVAGEGAFKVDKGTKLTKEIVDEAQKHDALLLLTMSIEA